MYKKLKLVKESTDVEKYWDATEIMRTGFVSLMRFNFGCDSNGKNYIICNDSYCWKRFYADSDEEAIKIFNEWDKVNLNQEFKDNHPELYKESTLNEDLEDEEEKEEEIEQTEEELEDTIDSEEDQEENPVEEESELDKQLDELRKVLVDLDLNLYQVTSKEDPNNSIYIIGKVADDTTDTLMLIDTKPEEHEDVKIEDEPIEQEINQDNPEEVENKEEVIDNVPSEENDIVEPDEKEEPVEQELETPEERFDFVVLPKKFEEINELNPRYGEDLTPDHEAIMDYLMNCLIEMNPEAAENVQDELSKNNLETDEDLPLPVDMENPEEEEDII